MNVVVVHYAELGLKGGNRRMFERKLMEDIRARLSPVHAGRVRLESARVLVELTENHSPDAVRAELGKVFGVAWFAFGRLLPWGPGNPGWDALADAAVALVRSFPQAKTFKVFARRAVKHYPLSSQDICVRLGKRIGEDTGLSVDLDHHDVAVHVEILTKEICFFAERTQGLRGLPKGSSGETLCLFSGGIDSPVAAWLMMRRGARVHYLHFHPFRSAAEVRDSKIFELDRVLRATSPSSKLYLVPHDRYQVAASLSVPVEYETVFFRRFMFRAAESLARREGYKALITGDSLGQVASQTLENLKAVQTELTLPVFQPVIAYDKESIVQLAQQIGTYEPSIRAYKDCCSLMAKKPKTNVATPVVRRLEERLDMPRLIEESLAQAEIWDGAALRPWTRGAYKEKTGGKTPPVFPT